MGYTLQIKGIMTVIQWNWRYPIFKHTHLIPPEIDWRWLVSTCFFFIVFWPSHILPIWFAQGSPPMGFLDTLEKQGGSFWNRLIKLQLLSFSTLQYIHPLFSMIGNFHQRRHFVFEKRGHLLRGTGFRLLSGDWNWCWRQSRWPGAAVPGPDPARCRSCNRHNRPMRKSQKLRSQKDSHVYIM